MVYTKHEYRIYFGSARKSWEKSFTYSFGSTREIQISMNKNGAMIAVKMGPLYKPADILTASNYLFSDAIRKTSLLFMVQYSCPLPVETILIYIDGIQQKWSDDRRKVASLMSGEFERRIPKGALSDDLAQQLLRKPKSKQDDLSCALNAYLYAKSKHYEADRLVYLWMALNGLYNHATTLVVQHNGVNQSSRNDSKAINMFVRLKGYGERLIAPRNTVDVIRKVIGILRGYPSLSGRESIPSKLDQEIQTVLAEYNAGKREDQQFNVTSYAYLLFGLAYHFRCAYFHANKPLPLCECIDAHEIYCMKVCNDLIEEFLDEELFKWFSDEYIEQVIYPKSESLYLLTH